MTVAVWIASSVILILLATAASVSAGYAGTVLPLLAFHAVFVVLLLSTTWMRRFYGYLALVFFLVLGFWTKYLIHVVLHARLGEPVGSFAGTQAQWDRVLWIATAGALGMLVVAAAATRWTRLVAAARTTAPRRPRREVPGWFVSRRRLVWAVAIAVVVCSAGLNGWLGIWQIGVGNRLILPLHLNAAVMWWFTMAAPIGLAILVDFERRSVGLDSGVLWMVALVTEAAASSTTTMSRGLFVMHLLPYYFIFAVDKVERGNRFRWRTVGLLSVITVVGFGACLTSVSWLRLTTYPTARLATEAPTVDRPSTPGSGPAPGPGAAPATPSVVIATGGEPSARQIRATVGEVAGLFITRWIGLEGIMAVTSFDERGAALFRKALHEDPRLGADSIYQRAAGNPYPKLSGFRFLTLPGVMAVLSYADSAWLVFGGMMAITLLVLAVDVVANRVMRNVFVSSVIGVGLSNIVAQMNFPYLYATFLVELAATLVVLWWVFDPPQWATRRG
jgi:hypothetical protein